MADLLRRGSRTSRTSSGDSSLSDPSGHLDITDAKRSFDVERASGRLQDKGDDSDDDYDGDADSFAHLSNGNHSYGHVLDGQVGGDGAIRWWVLTLACMVMFGNFYAYDLPAALNKPLQAYLNATDETYQYQLNLLYSLYSLPNIVLPFFGGYLVDRFGTRKLMTVLSSLVCLGQLLFTFGVIYRHYMLMQFGRIVFGLGGESLSVAGKELAFALGVNLSVSRLGTVLTDFLSPHLAIGGSVPAAIWAGFATCVISLLCGVGLNAIDAYGTSRTVNGAGTSYELLETGSSARMRQRHAKKSIDSKRSRSQSRASWTSNICTEPGVDDISNDCGMAGQQRSVIQAHRIFLFFRERVGVAGVCMDALARCKAPEPRAGSANQQQQ
ncbi:UNVERIFIED_CONTAM: hypothetical protein HDU68_007777 [Siphonaria sp. JEL0065]|nr:hypothetical protein HDU68_007777 [Siphonaria sp. JEL0065]